MMRFRPWLRALGKFAPTSCVHFAGKRAVLFEIPLESHVSTTLTKLVRRGGIEPPAFALGRQHKSAHIHLSLGLELFSPDSAGTQPRTKHMLSGKHP